MLQTGSEAAAAAAAATQVQATLQAQLAEQAAELAAARVEAENKAAQVCARIPANHPYDTSILAATPSMHCSTNWSSFHSCCCMASATAQPAACSTPNSVHQVTRFTHVRPVCCALNLLQASALSSQLYELQVVSEKRLVAAAAEGRAALQAERLELQVC